MNLLDDNDISDNDDINDLADIPFYILNEIEYDRKNSIILFYKNLLLKEPEFIGIKNINSGFILEKINNLHNTKNINCNKLILTNEAFNLFKKMFDELEINYNENSIIKLASIIYNKLYI